MVREKEYNTFVFADNTATYTHTYARRQ